MKPNSLFKGKHTKKALFVIVPVILCAIIVCVLVVSLNDRNAQTEKGAGGENPDILSSERGDEEDMEKLYERINFENSPSKKTPLNEENLNKMDSAIDLLDERVVKTSNTVAEIEEILIVKGTNLYNPTLQTSDTISPHYYVNGVQYESTQFDSAYNCTAPIEIEADTQYAIGLVPSVGGYTLPWGSASHGLFFYDKDGNYISGSLTTVFTTPSNAKYIRFNYNIGSPMGLSLDALNNKCMLVKGNALPTNYEAYTYETLDETVKKTAGTSYTIINNGDGIEIESNYGADTVKVVMKKKGGNNLFDFDSVIKKKGGALINGSGDWHSPFIMIAVNDVDGDNIDSGYFTGGNHQTNNQATGGAKTARTTSIKYFIDGKEVVSGSGSARTIEIRWTNMVQGYNTSKADGTGREILQENHVVIFRDGKFYTHVELVPLEDIIIKRWYGLQGVTSPYPNFKYVGGANRAVYTGNSSSGNIDAYEIVCFGSNDKMTISIDNAYDLGKRSTEMVSGASGIFTQDYGKCYFSIINKDVQMEQGDHYYLRGEYEFSPN